MTLQSIAHHVVPASLRDIGTGIYHLAKKDATKEHCQKLVTGAIRVSLAVQIAFMSIAAIALLPTRLELIFCASIILGSYLLDAETSTLAAGGLLTVAGMSVIAQGANLVAQRLFVSGTFGLIHGSVLIHVAWLVTRMPKDMKINFSFNLLKDKIDNLGDDWGSQLHRSLTKHLAWNA